MQRTSHTAVRAARLYAAAAHACRAAAAAAPAADAAQAQSTSVAAGLRGLHAVSNSARSSGSSGMPAHAVSCTSTWPLQQQQCSFSSGTASAAAMTAPGQPAAASCRSQAGISALARFASLPYRGSFGSGTPTQLSGNLMQRANGQVVVGMPLLSLRCFAGRSTQLAKGQAPPPGGQAISMRIAVASPNQLAEPYSGSPPKLPFFASWFTPAGWRDRWQRGMAGAKSMYTIRACKKNLEGWSLPGFKAEALKVYSGVCTALAAGNQNTLRQLVTSSVFSEMKKELRQREAAGWARVRWALEKKSELSEMEVVHGRLIYLNPKDDSSAFAQLTVRLRSMQSFAAYDARGKLLAGDPGFTFPVTDLWVFEISLRKNVANRWRLAARLDPTLQ